MTSDLLLSPLRDLVLREVLSTARAFDQEHQPSTAILNEASDVIASSLRQSAWFETIETSNQPLVAEYTSRDIDHLQAADFAAGWAGDILEYQGVRALANSFRRVIVNGHLLD